MKNDSTPQVSAEAPSPGVGSIDLFGLRRRLAMMNIAALACLCCGVFWGFAFDDFAQGRDSAFYFFSGLLLANMACVFNWLAWRGCPNTKSSHGTAQP